MTETRFRKIHLDFHNSPLIDSIGHEFDSEEFIKTLLDAYVNHIVVFAKCHHGMSYYDTKVGCKHPGLKKDMLKEIIDICHKHDILVSVYYSLGWDQEIARQHPEWIQLDRNHCHKGHFIYKNPTWKDLCFNSPYIDEVVIPATRELLENYDLDGIWYDTIYIEFDECYCDYCKERMKSLGLNPYKRGDQWKFTEITQVNVMKKILDVIKGIKPHIAIDYNPLVRIGARASVPYVTNYEIEALPHGWGYFFYPLYSRHIRTLGRSYNGITARFHRGWADFGSIKHPNQLKYEIFTMVANGGQCSIGDQMEPSGKIDRTVYEVIGEAYKEVKEREEWLKSAESIAEVAVLANSVPFFYNDEGVSSSLYGATKVLIEKHIQFDVVDEETDLSKYKLVILPDYTKVDEELRGKLKTYIDSGGKILTTYKAAFDDKRREFNLEGIGLRPLGTSDFSTEYVKLGSLISKGIKPHNYVLYNDVMEVEAIDESVEVLADTIHPIFERTESHYTSHNHAPPYIKSCYPCITKNDSIIYAASPLFSLYFNEGNLVYRDIIGNLIDILLPEKVIETDTSPSLEITLTKQGSRRIVHLVNYHANKRGRSLEVIEEVPPRFNIKLKYKPDIEVKKVYTAPQIQELKHDVCNGYINVEVPRVDIHQMVVFE